MSALRLVFLALFGLALVGCASQDVDSVSDPVFQDIQTTLIDPVDTTAENDNEAERGLNTSATIGTAFAAETSGSVVDESVAESWTAEITTTETKKPEESTESDSTTSSDETTIVTEATTPTGLSTAIDSGGFGELVPLD